MKTCNNCGQRKEDHDFNARKASKDGLQSKCRECQAALHREWQANNLDMHLANQNKYVSENTQKVYERFYRWAKLNKEKMRVYHLRWRNSKKEH